MDLVNGFLVTLRDSFFVYALPNTSVSEVTWLGAIGDGLTVLSYIIMPILLWRFTLKKDGIQFSVLFKAFAIFILFCGIEHVFHIINVWEPLTMLTALSKMASGLVSVAIVVLLIKAFPKAIRIPSPQELEDRNKELERLNEDLKETLEAADMGTWVVDLISRKTTWSPIVYQIHEVEEGTEIFLEEAIKYYHHDSKDEIEHAVNRAIEYGEPWDLELKLLTSKGNVVWARAIGKAIYENGEVVKLKGLFQNINPMKLRVQKIEESERKLKESQKIGRFGNWSWDIENDELEWSDELYRIFGQNRSSFKPSYNSLKGLIHADDQRNLDKDVEAAIRLKRPHDLIHRISWPNGEIRYVHERGKVNYDEKSGQPVSMAGTTQDVTDRVLVEKELKESELALREAEKITGTGNWKWFQQSGRHVWSDERYRILGYEPGEVEPSLEVAFELIEEQDKPRVKTIVNNAVAKNADYDFEYRIISAKGECKVIREKGRFHNEGGLFSKTYIGTVQDVTIEHERKEELQVSLQALERSNEELQSFAYVASHDLQEPLRVINSYLQLIEMSYKEIIDDEGKLFIQNTINAASRMKRLINDLLVLSRLETKQRIVKPIDLNELMAHLKEDLKIAIEESDAKIVYEQLPVINGDPSQIKQLFQNLIGNAIKFQRADVAPFIKVSVLRKGQIHEFQIEDNGIGIDENYHSRIFTIFQRLHAKEEYQGTGIGLAICKKVVERHNGNISIESALGKGSVFTFTLNG